MKKLKISLKGIDMKKLKIAFKNKNYRVNFLSLLVGSVFLFLSNLFKDFLFVFIFIMGIIFIWTVIIHCFGLKFEIEDIRFHGYLLISITEVLISVLLHNFYLYILRTVKINRSYLIPINITLFIVIVLVILFWMIKNRYSPVPK